MSDTEKALTHYQDQLKAMMFAEVVAALRNLVDLDGIEEYRAAKAVLEKIDSNELLRS